MNQNRICTAVLHYFNRKLLKNKLKGGKPWIRTQRSPSHYGQKIQICPQKLRAIYLFYMSYIIQYVKKISLIWKGNN